jgi:SulP family sulfate permease
VPEDQADTVDGKRGPYNTSLATDPDVVVYRITGAFFFGAAGAVSALLDSVADRHKAFVLDFSAVPFIDTTAANSITGVVRKARRHNVAVVVSGAAPDIRRALETRGIDLDVVIFCDGVDEAVVLAHTFAKHKT